MMLAMTSIAVTASICANASEAALLVASFMPFSLDLGVTHRCARTRERRSWFTRNTPRRVFALIESPLSEHRPCQGRIVMRRHFDSRVTRLVNITVSNGNGYLIRQRATKSKTPGVNHGPYRLLRS